MRNDPTADCSSLTRSQWSIWAGQQLDPDLPLYNMVLTFTFDGAIAPARFSQAFQRLLDASDTLRSVFEASGGVPHRRVREPFESPLVFVDLSAEPDPAGAADEWVRARCTRIFDLTQCLFDTALLKLGERRFVWYLNQHHLITDGWSKAVIYQNLSDSYERLALGEDGEPPVLPSYTHYAEFERSNRESRQFKAAHEYWKTKLETRVAPAAFYNGPPSGGDARTVRVPLALGRERSAAIKAACQEKGVFFFNLELTLSIVFTALLFGYLQRIGNGPRLRIGVPFHNRSTASFKNTLGLFMEIYSLELELEAQETFTSLLGKLTREVQTVLVNAQPGVTSTGSNKAYDVFVNLVNIRFADFAGAPVSVDWLHSGYADRNHSLRLQVHDFSDSGAFVLHFDLNRSAFPDAETSPVRRHFLRMIDAFLADRGQAVSGVALSDGEESVRLLTFARGPRSSVEPVDVLEQIARQAQTTPDAVAVSCRARQLTYRELQSRSDRLAGFLRDAGVARGTLVGLCTWRSAESVIGILGILKAGGAYVPLDPNYPARRLQHMLEAMQRAAAAPVLLTQESLAGRFSQQAATVVCLDRDWDRIAASADAAQPADAGADDLAYVIFTSGSTGQPKGVMVRRAGLAHYVSWANRTYVCGETRSFPLYSSLSFDLTVTSLFVPLVSGGRIVVYPEDPASDALAVLEVIDDNQVEIVKLTPSHLALLGTRALRDSRVKTLIVGGEDFKTAQANAALALFGEGVEIYNEYGPTEAVVGCMIHRFDAAADSSGSVPIGRPIDDTGIYVLDSSGQPAPCGIPGELHIASPALARGYLGQLQLTAERFIANPFDGHGLMYATGDLARWRGDGVLEYLGRTDEQIKLRGARIELGDVESALLDFDGIREAVAALQHGPAGAAGAEPERGAGLAAYYVADTAVPDSELRAFLGDRLPEYMQPTWFARLPEIPLTPNGKADRQALPPPTAGDAAVEDDYRAPRTPAETALAEIWASLLGMPRVGVNANFFALGGDSIINIQICSRARRSGLHIEPGQIFRHPTVESLARVAQVEEAVSTEQAAVTGPVPLTPIQRRFFEQMHPAPEHWNQAMLLKVPADLPVDCLDQALQHLRVHHDALRSRYTQERGAWLQVIDAPACADSLLQVVELGALDVRAEELQIAEVEAAQQRSLDLERGDLVRCVLFRRAAGQPALLLLIIHHLVVDGVSWYILLQDLERLCDQLRKGHEPGLPAKTTSFKTWAERIADYATSAAAQRQARWWCDLPPGPSEPVREDCGIQQTERIVRVSLPAERTRALLKEVPAAYNTRTDEVLLTALLAVLAGCSGSLRVDLEGHGRESVVEGSDLSRTVGWFTSIYPVCLEPAGARTPAAALIAVKEQLRAVPDNGVGYGLLRYLGGDSELTRTLGSQPRARVLFNYLGRLDGLLDEGSQFRLARELVLSQDPGCRRPYEIIIDAFVIHGRLQVNWRYGETHYSEQALTELTGAFLTALDELIDHCLSADAGALTPADFPDTGLTPESLGALLEEFGE